MTIIMTLIGLVVFFISLIARKGFKTSLLRLLIMTGVGLVIDVILSVFAAIVMFHSL